MKKRKTHIFFIAGVLFCLQLFVSCKNTNDNRTPEKIKVAMREVGNRLLLANNDSTSLVLPVQQLTPSTYQIAFETSLSISPDSLVSIVERSFEKSQLTSNYLVEVHHCENRGVAYSYEISFYEESTIIPCSGRNLPKDCYQISIDLNNSIAQGDSINSLWYVSILGSVLFMGFVLMRKKSSDGKPSGEHVSKKIGMFIFYPDQNKLVKHSDEIKLSKKECELLEILVESRNQLVRREELTKRVWEDNGVFVGRSLDTYISKLRKKLVDDDGVQITNVHGVGYKLETSTD